MGKRDPLEVINVGVDQILNVDPRPLFRFPYH